MRNKMKRKGAENAETSQRKTIELSLRSSAFSAVLSPNFVAFCEDFPGARLSQPPPPRLPTVGARLFAASFCFCNRCGWDSRAPVWLRLRRAVSLRFAGFVNRAEEQRRSGCAQPSSQMETFKK